MCMNITEMLNMLELSLHFFLKNQLCQYDALGAKHQSIMFFSTFLCLKNNCLTFGLIKQSVLFYSVWV